MCSCLPCMATQLESLLPPDAHVRCSGLVHIAITRVRSYGSLCRQRVSEFASREDLMEALMASCHIPLLATGKLSTRFRGK